MGSVHTSEAGRVTVRPYRAKTPRAETLPAPAGLLALNERVAAPAPAADESPMITALYEAHLCMEEMRLACADLRGDERA